ncbi:MAG TPA: hypothetical protein VIF57_24335 [Polyangia bacterium]|jgi:hypothetical protein
MSHLIDRCDIIDIMEASARTRRAVAVELKEGRHFTDQVRQVNTDDDGEWVVFRQHDRVLVDDISFAAPAEQPEPSYRGKI